MDLDDEQPVASSSRVTLDSLPIANSSALTMGLQIETSVVISDEELNLRSQGSKGPTKDLSGEGLIHHIDHEMSDTEDEDDHAHYELERQRRIRENQLLIDSLGLKPTSTPGLSSFSMNTPTRSSTKRKKREGHKEVFDRSGYIVSLPAPGERRQRMACVEMPNDRQLRKRIADGEYADCEHWWEGEERRWRFGHGQGEDRDGEEEDFGGVKKDFRWRKWRGLEKELRAEMKQRGEMNSRDKAGNQHFTSSASEPTPYSLIQGDPCHQCRRKSDKAKMRCRNVNPMCRAVFCETCCKRYSYFDFDTESRSFICPLCRDCCNCANCIRKRDLHHLLGPGRVGAKSKDQLESGMTVQAWLEKATQEKRGVPFERVRLVDQATDIISPDLPPETPPPAAKTARSRKRKVKAPRNTKAKKPKKPSKQDEKEDVAAEKENDPKIKIKIKAPSKPAKVKEVDSEGDTVGGYSDDDDTDSVASSKLTSLSDRASRSSNMSPRPDFATLDYLASLVSAETINGADVAPSRTVPTPAAAMSHSTNTTDDSGGRPPVVSNESQESVPNSGKKRRRPPPKANILRAPKYTQQTSAPACVDAATPFQTEPQTPLTADVPQTWQDEPTPMHFQSFSYEGYSALPPSSEFPLMPIPVPQMPTMNFSMHSYPPPYSHSPPARQAGLDAHAMPAYVGSAMMAQHMPVVQPHVLARTGVNSTMPILHNAAAGSFNTQGTVPGYNAKHVIGGPVRMQRLSSGGAEPNVQPRGGFWQDQNMLGMVVSRPRGGTEMENGLMLNRQYYPGHP